MKTSNSNLFRGFLSQQKVITKLLFRGFLGKKNSKATSRGLFRHLRGPQYQNRPQKWTPRPKIEGKLPPKLFFRTYLGLYQHRVDDCPLPGSLKIK